MKIGALIEKIAEDEEGGTLPVPPSSRSEVLERVKQALLAEEKKSEGTIWSVFVQQEKSDDMDMGTFRQVVVEASMGVLKEWALVDRNIKAVKAWAVAVWVRKHGFLVRDRRSQTAICDQRASRVKNQFSGIIED